MELPQLLLTPRSLEFLSQFVLASLFFSFLVYQLHSTRHLHRQPGTRYLVAAVGVHTLTLLVLSFYFSLLAIERLPMRILSDALLLLFVLLFVRFAYRTPDLPPEWEKEDRIAFRMSLVAAAVGIGTSLVRLAASAGGKPYEQVLYQDVLSMLVVAWAVVVLARQTLRVASRADPNASRIAQLFFVPAKEAKSTRGFLFGAAMVVLLFFLILISLEIWYGTSLNARATAASLASALVLIALLLVSINTYLPSTSLVVQLTGIVAAIMMLVGNTVGTVTIQALAQTQNGTSVETTPKRILFTPDDPGGYRVEVLPLAAEDADLTALAGACARPPTAPLAASDTMDVELPFAFSFYGKTWTRVFLYPQGFLTFGQPQTIKNLEYRYGNIPSIFALHRSVFGPDAARSGGVESFEITTRTATNRIEFFWCVPAHAESSAASPGIESDRTLPPPSLRVVLNADQSFAIDHIAVAPVPYHSALTLLNYWRWWVGAHDGNIARPPQHIDWKIDSTAQPSITDRSLVENYQITVRSDTDLFIRQLAAVVLFSMLTATGALPLLLHAGFMQPLTRLLSGIRRTERGDLTVQIETHLDNEIGIITRAVNQFIATQHDLTGNLEAQVKERTQMLSLTNQQLHQEIELHRQTQAEMAELNLHLEDKVQERTRELAANEARFRRVVTSIRDAVYALTINTDTLESTVEYASPALQTFGIHFTATATSNLRLWLARQVVPEERERIWQHFTEVLGGGESWIETRVVQTDGTHKWVRNSLRGEQIEPGKVRCYGVMSDISARKALEQETAQREALEEINRLRSEWLANLSHELRTPLGVIKTATTTLMAKDVIIPPEIQQFVLQQLDSESDRLKQFFDTLLDLAQSDTAPMKLRYSQTDLVALLQGLVSEVRHQMKLGAFPPFTVKLETAAPDLPLMADPERLRVVFQNLLSNAMKFSPDGTTITIRARRSPHSAVVEVEDQGSGIDEAEFERIFERYYKIQSKNLRTQNGVGLGLSICREIVAAHGGTIRLTSRRDNGSPQNGTTFIVQLPCWPANAASDAHEPPSQC